MATVSTATTLSANAAGAIILPDGTDYTGGLTINLTSAVETLYIPLGYLNTSGDNHLSNGSVVDLSNIFLTYLSIPETIQTDAGGALIESYTPTYSNKALLDNVVGNTGADYISGNTLANQLYGGGAWDYVFGMSGNDTIYGGTGYSDPNDYADYLYGGGGADLIFGNAGNDIINGGKEGEDAIGGIAGYVSSTAANDTEADGADFIYGGLGNDYIHGNAGNDTIYGGGASVDPTEGGDYIFGDAGDDYLHGGVGDDVFIIAASAGQDVIAHFEGAGVAGGDVLRLTANMNGTGIDTVAELLANAITDASGMWINLGGGNGLTIAGVTTLSADDVVFV